MKTSFTKRSTDQDVLQGIDLSGKTVLVTGCNSGLGFETVRMVSRRVLGDFDRREDPPASILMVCDSSHTKLLFQDGRQRRHLSEDRVQRCCFELGEAGPLQSLSLQRL